MEFVKSINGKFTELEADPFGAIMDVENMLLVARNIDIGIHPFSNILSNDYHGSYPISNTNNCILVPVVPEIFPGFYIPLTLNLNMWVLLLAMFFAFQVVYFLMDAYSFGQWKSWESVSITLRGMLGMSLGAITTTAISTKSLSAKRKLTIHMLVILTGMMYTNILIAALASSLSATIYGKQLETLEDLRQANIPIMMVDYLFFTYSYLELIPIDYAPNILVADVETISQHLNSLNTSYAYVVYNEEWKVVQSVQKNLWKPRFRVAQKLCIANVYLSLPMQFNSPFYHPLKNFILRIRETGLELKWTDDILRDIRQTAVNNNTSLKESEERPVPLTLVHFSVMWGVWVIGMITATIVFLWELFKHRTSKRYPLKTSKTNKKISVG